MADVAYGSLPFAEQIAFFRRKLNLPTNAWTDIWQQAHDHAFVVAGANRMDLVRDFRDAVDAAIANGETLEQFRKRFDAIVTKYGWDYNGGRNWRSRVIYETNLRTSYAAGRFAQLQAVKQVRPYWLYVHADGENHPRPLHLKWGNEKLTLPADDPWWLTHFPPNGWGCKCTVHALNARDLKRLGKDGPDEAPPDDMQQVTVGTRGPTPRTVETPAGVDPGFGYAPGRDAFESWLRGQSTQATERAAAQERAGWTPLLQTVPEDLGRPALIPLQPVPVPLGPQLDSADQVVQALTDLLGAPTRVFDVHDLPVAIDASVLGNHIAKDLGRSPFLPLLVDLLENPWEVWLSLEQSTQDASLRTTARLIKGYALGKGKSVMLVATEQDGILTGWTFMPSGPAYANKQRTGLLWYARDKAGE